MKMVTVGYRLRKAAAVFCFCSRAAAGVVCDVLCDLLSCSGDAFGQV